MSALKRSMDAPRLTDVHAESRPAPAKVNAFLGTLLLLLVITLTATATASSLRAPMSVHVDGPKVAASRTTYRLRVLAEGVPVAALLPAQVDLATLVVNGAVVQRAGQGSNRSEQTFGHGAPSFQLSGLKRIDRVEVVEYGPSGPPEIVTFSAGSIVYRSGLGSGFYYGILVSIMMFQLLLGSTTRDQTRFWYAGWIMAAIGVELTRDALLPLAPALTENMHLLLIASVTICSAGFTATYLKLFSESRRLFWVLVAGSGLPMLGVVLVAFVTRSPFNVPIVYSATSIGYGIVVLVAVLRRRAGFLPAPYAALGVIALLAVFVSRIVRDATHMPVPFLDHWGVEMGSVFDYCVFSLGLLYRSRFTQAQRETLEKALQSANVVASTDQLTGLLNRRGFEAALPERMTCGGGTLLFIDIDGFKTVNDEGGHAAGDYTLIDVARILQYSVRKHDQVARYGGDEFVIFLAGCNNSTIVQQIAARISSAVTSLRPLGAQCATRIGVSIGIEHVSEMRLFAEALRKADADAYRVKAEHRAFARASAGAGKDPGGSLPDSGSLQVP